MSTTTTYESLSSIVASARRSFQDWGALPVEERLAFIEGYGRILEQESTAMAQCISSETGKPLWESRTEVGAMKAKLAASIRAFRERCHESEQLLGDVRGALRYKPLGVAGVLGPFNLPGHLPNAHIVPALIAGNTLVFKPSEFTPDTGERLVEHWQQCGLPEGVLNRVQGDGGVGDALVRQADLDAVFFTGSYATGRRINQALADHPEKMLVMEMGGNNPLLVHHVCDVDATVYGIILSAFITAGQRCTCARRLILMDNAEGEMILERLVDVAGRLNVGCYTQTPEPFMGPVISLAAAERVLSSVESLQSRGGVERLGLRPADAGLPFLRPGIMDVTHLSDRPDEELFGPFLQVIRVGSLAAGIAECNRTRYGLAASLYADDPADWAVFRNRVRAGVVNWNRPTTGASGAMPFGGCGRSGNYRPGGFFAADYCSYPVASLEAMQMVLPDEPVPGLLF